MTSRLIGCALLLAPAPAIAQTVRLSPIGEARVRWERVEQDGIARPADAVTVRVRSGVTAQRDAVQLLVEAQATLAVVERYNSGTNDLARYPLVVDPQNVDLARAQLRYAAGGVAATAGRQRIELADQRFVGSGSIRQAGQAFDALRVQWGKPRGLVADLTYAWSQRTVNGINGRGARPQAVGGDNVFMLVGGPLPVGTLTGFAYLVDQDDAAVQGFRLSSQTWGARLTGTAVPVPGWSLGYAASYARQSDWHRNPNDYSASYWLAEATARHRRLAVTAGHEVLGAGDGRPLTSVQTPLSSIFKFQGWADRFVTTPPDGIRDLYGTIALDWQATRGFDAIGLSATVHRFRSDRLVRPYGSELNLLASVRRGRTTLSARYARYRADGFATHTDKLWLQSDWVI